MSPQIERTSPGPQRSPPPFLATDSPECPGPGSSTIRGFCPIESLIHLESHSVCSCVGFFPVAASSCSFSLLRSIPLCDLTTNDVSVLWLASASVLSRVCLLGFFPKKLPWRFLSRLLLTVFPTFLLGKHAGARAPLLRRGKRASSREAAEWIPRRPDRPCHQGRLQFRLPRPRLRLAFPPFVSAISSKQLY